LARKDQRIFLKGKILGGNPLIKFLLITLCVFSLEALLPERVIVCGVCRDVDKALPKTIKIMESIGKRFKDYRVIVYENNSVDTTKDLLKNWSTFNKRVKVISENVSQDLLSSTIVNRNKDGRFFRPEEIARARNKVLDEIFSPAYKRYTHVIWIDMDFKIPPSLAGIEEVFYSTKEWDAVFAYGVDPSHIYWDWYAFRDYENPLGSELLGNTWWYQPKTFSLSIADDWCPVYSAFGGCGIYKKSSIQGCRYSGTVTSDLESVVKHIIETHPDNGAVKLYKEMLEETSSYITLGVRAPNLPKIEDPLAGILLNNGDDPIVWRMSTFVYQYPSVCEHVPFHASMIINGHGKLFINPRLLFYYGN
jgi:hypothetical protein